MECEDIKTQNQSLRGSLRLSLPVWVSATFQNDKYLNLDGESAIGIAGVVPHVTHLRAGFVLWHYFSVIIRRAPYLVHNFKEIIECH